MRPLIPRVYVGDILKGTKNLRNWLRTASLYYYLKNLRTGAAPGSIPPLHTPSKEDKFLVTVNAWNTFGVFGLNGNTVLLFVRPSAASRVEARRNPDWISPSTFSRWFVRTPEKRTDTQSWPITAYYMRSSLHFNLCAQTGRPGGLKTLPFRPSSASYESVFEMSINGTGYQRGDINQLTGWWICRGVTRANQQSKPVGGPRSRNWSGWGPRLSDLETLRLQIQELCANPRIAQNLKRNKQHVALVLNPEQVLEME